MGDAYMLAPQPQTPEPTMYVIAYLTRDRQLVTISTPSLITAQHVAEALDPRMASNVRVWRGNYDIWGWVPDLM